MKLRTRVVWQLATLCFVLAAYGFAADNAYLYIVHGIPGLDIASNVSPAFPVDVLISGVCVPRNLAFDIVSGPYSFSPGTYAVQVSDANTLAPCTNPTIIDSQVTLSAGKSVSAVLTIGGGQPTLLQFSDDLPAVTAGYARFTFVQAAEAGTLEATLTQPNVSNPKSYTVTAAAGSQQGIKVPEGTYLVQVFVSGGSTVLASETILLAKQSAGFAYAVGEAANSSLELINKTVQGTF
jgi:uncharacterized protein DUF4397